MSLGKLRVAMLLTMTLLFGFVAGVFGLVVWFLGPQWSLGQGLFYILVFTVLLTVGQWWMGPWMIRQFTRMRELKEGEYPWLQDMVRDLAKKAGIPKPKLYLVMDATPNAFAFGRTPSDSNIAIHAGLLNVLNKEEVEAVVAHEVGHIKHWDVPIIMVASMVPMLVYYLVVFFMARQTEDRGGASPILVFLAAFVAQFLSRLIVMYLSRTREYYADAFSAAATRNPTALQTALAKIVYGFPAGAPASSSQDKRAFYIADPVSSAKIAQAVNEDELGKNVEESERVREKEGAKLGASEIKHAIEWERTAGGAKIGEIFGTHPLTYKRLDALEELKKDLPPLEAV
ncbi:Protease HtpX [Candidatus Norongarragalina meridionalis]|nr:Protease HtpX [Candidatus Norongarragalina meridionalis]